VPARTRARSTIKIESNNNLYPYRYFAEHLVCAFGKTLWESDLNYETLSFSIRQLKNLTMQQFSLIGKIKLRQLEVAGQRKHEHQNWPMRSTGRQTGVPRPKAKQQGRQTE
jgi:hypothetical protein